MKPFVFKVLYSNQDVQTENYFISYQLAHIKNQTHQNQDCLGGDGACLEFGRCVFQVKPKISKLAFAAANTGWPRVKIMWQDTVACLHGLAH